jgi:predicted Zn-dependent protease
LRNFISLGRFGKFAMDIGNHSLVRFTCMSRFALVQFAALVVALGAGTGELSSVGPAYAAELQIAQARATPAVSAELQRSRFETSMGGFYADPVVRRYVIGIGSRLTANIDGAEEYGPEFRAFEYHVLDSATVGAYVLPPGVVYVTRGLLAVASNEAEVAAAVAHELAHITLGHARRAVPQEIARNREALTLYNRELEINADQLSLEYLVRAGYQPAAQAAMLRKVAADFEVQSRLSELQRRPASVRAETRDAITERLRLVEIALQDTVHPRPAIATIDRHLEIVDGMVFGDLPNVGIVRGRSFYHSGLRMTFEAPAEFSIATGRVSLFAAGPGGASMDIERRELRGTLSTSMTEYLRRFGSRGVELSEIEESIINGMPAASGIALVASRQGVTYFVRLAAIQFSPTLMLSVRYAIPADAAEAMQGEVARSLSSIRALTDQEAQAVQPLHVDVVSVAPGETLQSLAARMSVGDLRFERFLALNGFGIATAVPPGTRVKLIVD